MNLLDLLVVVAVVSAVMGGYRLGFLARAASWVGLVLGLFIAVRELPAAIRLFDGSTSASRLMVAAIFLVGASLLGQALGLLVGSRIRSVLPLGPLHLVDKGAGAVAGALGVLAAVWLLLPAMGDSSPTVSREVRNSVIARYLDAHLPRPPSTLQALRRLVGDNRFPSVFDALRPSTVAGPPPADTGLTPAVQTRVVASTVKVQGEACHRIQEGSGFAVEPNLVVTNAHVVAGERATEVQRPDGRSLAATVVLFDPDRDLALLRVGALGEVPLSLATGGPGTLGDVFGHPEGTPKVVISPARVQQEVDAVGRDLYDSHTTHRDVFILASVLRPGDSGGALVDRSGVVIGVAFAIAPDSPSTAYALSTREVTAELARARAAAVGTGPCLAD